MGLSFWQKAFITGGAAADVVRPAEALKDKNYKDAFDKFVDNNVPRFMEARQKRISIKNNLKGQLNTIVATYVRPTDLNISQNSAYELAEKLLFDNGGKIENINTRYKNEMANSNDKNYSPAMFINKYFNNPKDNKDSRSIDQILEYKANQLAPDPTIDIAGKAESLAGYKDSAFYTMDRDTVKARLIAATGFTEPNAITTNAYDNVKISPESFDKKEAMLRENQELTLESNKNQIENFNVQKAIGSLPAGKLTSMFNNNLRTSFSSSGIKHVWNGVTGKFEGVQAPAIKQLASVREAFQSTSKFVFESKDFDVNKPEDSKTYVLPELNALANGIIPERPPIVEGSDQIQVYITEDNGEQKPVVGQTKMDPTGQKYKVDVNKLQIGRLYVDKSGKKFMFTRMKTVSTTSGKSRQAVDPISVYYFD
tara:strand:- start:61 stop:1335 length:1275 start_codon:yes stop_codon:yes gene_type:complete